MDKDVGSDGQTDSARARLGRELRRLRKESSLTQAGLAERLGYVREYVTLAESTESPSRGLSRSSVDISTVTSRSVIGVVFAVPPRSSPPSLA